ncbi:MAG: MFS transporter, partial [Candidatus Marinimicrobia bacterium]|nr:MFS transporter [Candidatus Neomarinimicrobiota bacterium]
GLQDVNINIQSLSSKPIVQPIQASQLTINELEGELRIISIPEDINISLNQITKAKADSILNSAKNWNIEKGFAEDPKSKTMQEEAKNNKASWKYNLENFIRTNFGEETSIVDRKTVGNMGVLYFYLSKKPESGETIVVNFGRNSGDKNISLIEGTRFVFTENNWNIPAASVFQLDNKLDYTVSAEYRATAGNIPLSWSITFFILAALFVFFFLYHRFALPVVEKENKNADLSNVFSEFFKTFKLFFTKDKILVSIAFLLLYRLGESQLVKLASPFLLDAQEAGGLGLTTGQVGFVYGTVGILMLTLGGILGGFLAAKQGLKYWLWWMAIAINLPNAVYIYLSYALPDNFFFINLAVGIEQFGYGFGFTAYMLYMIAIADGEYKTAHFAIATAFMALGMMIPGMTSGWLQELIGYQHFFIWVVIATIPSFIILKFIPLDPNFGKKEEA